jgi:hypothetical protein
MGKYWIVYTSQFTRLKMNLHISTLTHPRFGIYNYIYTYVNKKFYTYMV